MAGVRLSGQDSERGTFNQRHAILFDQQTGRRCVHTASPQCQICRDVFTCPKGKQPQQDL
jgi:2-oxoglutarate dehydrogenase E1 component